MLGLFRHSRANSTDGVAGQTFSVSPDVTAQVHAEGLVVLHRTRGLVFTANRVGARIWEALSRHEALKSAVSELSQEYGVPSEQVLEDAQQFLGDLRRNGLIEGTL